MKTFQDLLDSGFNNLPPRDVKRNTYGQDLFIRMYNNIWGVISDTHMSQNDFSGEYVISGSMLRDRNKFNTFLYSYNWGGYQFSTSSIGCNCLSEYLSKNGYCGTWKILDGEFVYSMIPADSIRINGCGCCDCCCKSAQGGVEDVAFERRVSQKALRESLDGTIGECINNLNECSEIEGKQWSANTISDTELKFINENGNSIVVTLDEGFMSLALGLGAIYVIGCLIDYKYIADDELKDQYKGDPLAPFKCFNDGLVKDWKEEDIKSLERSEELKKIFDKYYNEKVRDINSLRNELAKKISAPDIKLLNKLAEKLKTN